MVVCASDFESDPWLSLAATQYFSAYIARQGTVALLHCGETFLLACTGMNEHTGADVWIMVMAQIDLRLE